MSDQSLVQDNLSDSCAAIVLDALVGVQALEDGPQNTDLDVGVL